MQRSATRRGCAGPFNHVGSIILDRSPTGSTALGGCLSIRTGDLFDARGFDVDLSRRWQSQSPRFLFGRLFQAFRINDCRTARIAFGRVISDRLISGRLVSSVRALTIWMSLRFAIFAAFSIGSRQCRAFLEAVGNILLIPVLRRRLSRHRAVSISSRISGPFNFTPLDCDLPNLPGF